MSILDQLWDDTVAGPRPDSGLGKLRKHPTFSLRSSSFGKEQKIGSPRSVGDLSSPRSVGNEGGDDMRVTRSVMIMKPPTSSSKDSPPVSPAWSTPSVSPFSADGFVVQTGDPEGAANQTQQNVEGQRNCILIVEKVTDSLPKSSQAANRSNGPPYAQSIVMSTENDDGISFEAIGGTAGQLLEQNAQALDQISSNFTSFKINDNINLFYQARNNILTILNDSLNDLPEVMKQMPPLPVKLNEELANSILPPPSSTKN